MKNIYTLLVPFLFSFTVAAQTSQVQFINNSADSLARLVKVSMNGTLEKDSLGYRKATPFMDVAGDISYTITFQSKLDTSKSVSVVSTLQAGKKYVFILNGVVYDTAYQANPDSISTSLNIVMVDQSSLTVPSSSQATLALVNGSTDAPAFDVYATDSTGTLLADNDSLNNVLSFTVQDTVLRLKIRTSDGAFNISTFSFDLTNAGGQTLTALTTGFLAPGSNRNGANFSVYFVDSLGNVISAQNVSVVRSHNNLLQNVLLYPNPARDFIHIQYTLTEAAALKFTIFDIKGDVIQDNSSVHLLKGLNEHQISIAGIPAGIYFLQIASELSAETVSFIVE